MVRTIFLYTVAVLSIVVVFGFSVYAIVISFQPEIVKVQALTTKASILVWLVMAYIGAMKVKAFLWLDTLMPLEKLALWFIPWISLAAFLAYFVTVILVNV